MSAAADQCIPTIVRQHAEESAHLRVVRTRLLGAPDITLSDLTRHDERIAAHLDGLSVAGPTAWKLCMEGLETPGVGELFAAATTAIENRDSRGLGSLLALIQAVPEVTRGFVSAFGWVSAQQLQGIIKGMLGSADPMARWTGLVACALHRVDPQVAARIRDDHPEIRARALRTAGELGKHELVSALAIAIADEDAACQFWAAWSATLLGARQNALESLQATALVPGPWQSRALQLALLTLQPADAHALLRQLAGDPGNRRALIRGAGLAGDPAYAAWLMGQMADPQVARLAGEAFSLLTGADLGALGLDRKAPEDVQAGPNDDPDDPNVDMDADEGLAWPDPERVQAWWVQNETRFTQGVRHFVGAPPSRGHCIEVLKTGYQRQRIVAAYHLCLLNPGTPLFEWRAPGWRQQRELARLA